MSTTCLNMGAHGRCRKCSGCLESRLRSWVARLIMESLEYEQEQVTFCTFTYAPDHLPTDVREAKRQFQLFLKKLRKLYLDRSIRYVAALEKGTSGTMRFHWHAIIFGLNFNSETNHFLRKTWGKGFIDLKPCTPGRMAYVLKYVIKGGAFLMSRRPGIGAEGINYLNATIGTLSLPELDKIDLQAKVRLQLMKFACSYARQSRSLTALRIGKYYFPVHQYYKQRLKDLRRKY